MIYLSIHEYCENCPNFEASVDVTVIESCNPERPYTYNTVIKCEHENKCKNMMRYLKTEVKKNDV